MSADAESAYGQPWFQQSAPPHEPSNMQEPSHSQSKRPVQDSYPPQHRTPESAQPQPGIMPSPANPVTRRLGSAALAANLQTTFADTTAQVAAGVASDMPVVLHTAQRRMTHALSDQVTPVRLASHLSVLLVAAIVLIFSRVQIPEWDFQLAAMPTEQPADAGFNSVTTRMAELLGNPAAASIDNELQPQIVPFTIIPERTRQVVQIYSVAAGDTVLGIAHRFGLAPETLQWSNPELEANPDLLRIGDQLKILPLNGVLHTVRAGDTLSSLAQRYKVGTDQIIAYKANSLADANAPLVIGSEIVIPGGTKPFVPVQVVAMSLNAVSAPPGSNVGSGNFGWPASGSISQAYWNGHRGLDIASRTGAPVKAADSGFVTIAGGGWNAGYGNHVMIDHGNGFVTLYAHLNTVFVKAGENVGAGQQIGTVGNTGNSTGPHLHFEIRYQGIPRNPNSYLR